jgi:lipoprotein-releasing system permease protein
LLRRHTLFNAFFKHFLHYIFFARTRQRLLFLALGGLALSSFALIVLQSTMGGLQHGLVSRSHEIEGFGEVDILDLSPITAGQVVSELESMGVVSHQEYEMEALARHENFISPVVVHGVDIDVSLPVHLQDFTFKGLVLGRDLSAKLHAMPGEKISLVSPSHSVSFMGEVPRQSQEEVEGVVETLIPQVDLFHLWARLPFVQNLIGNRAVNRVKITACPGSRCNLKLLAGQLEQKFPEKVRVFSWEDRNASLVFALKLETTVMVFLFIITTFLVAISITSGFLVFFGEIRPDLVSFWILGASKKILRKQAHFFLHLVSFFVCLGGLLLGLTLLVALSHFQGDIMPEVFVDRKIPVHVTWFGVISSFLVPYAISFLFSWPALGGMKGDEKEYLEHLRSC